MGKELTHLQERQVNNLILQLNRKFKQECEHALEDETTNNEIIKTIDHKLKEFLFNELSDAYNQGLKDSLLVVREILK